MRKFRGNQDDFTIFEWKIKKKSSKKKQYCSYSKIPFCSAKRNNNPCKPPLFPKIKFSLFNLPFICNCKNEHKIPENKEKKPFSIII